MVRVEEGEHPDEANQDRYAEVYPLFREAYQVLESTFEQLGRM
jgi:hypothetical protein